MSAPYVSLVGHIDTYVFQWGVMLVIFVCYIESINHKDKIWNMWYEINTKIKTRTNKIK